MGGRRELAQQQQPQQQSNVSPSGAITESPVDHIMKINSCSTRLCFATPLCGNYFEDLPADTTTTAGRCRRGMLLLGGRWLR